jgi:hypothetical protein
MRNEAGSMNSRELDVRVSVGIARYRLELSKDANDVCPGVVEDDAGGVRFKSEVCLGLWIVKVL